MLISFLLGGLLFLFLKSRINRLALTHEEQIQQTKNDLLALASHQLRTPASGVKQYIGMLQQGYAGTISEEQKSMLDKAFNANERQIEIINQLLYVAKADAGQLALTPISFDMHSLWNDVIEEQCDQAEVKSITVQFSSTEQKVMIEADKKMVRMALENLLSNAIKYSPENSTVIVTLKRGAGQVVSRVTDEGVGISQEDQLKLFRKFSRIENELSAQVSGSGIGLFLVHQIAAAHRGDITVNSSPAIGSTFTFILPVKSKK
jgi:signal transduction histidine kinase